jgi:hypothetical protein
MNDDLIVGVNANDLAELITDRETFRIGIEAARHADKQWEEEVKRITARYQNLRLAVLGVLALHANVELSDDTSDGELIIALRPLLRPAPEEVVQTCAFVHDGMSCDGVRGHLPAHLHAMNTGGVCTVDSDGTVLYSGHPSTGPELPPAGMAWPWSGPVRGDELTPSLPNHVPLDPWVEPDSGPPTQTMPAIDEQPATPRRFTAGDSMPADLHAVDEIDGDGNTVAQWDRVDQGQWYWVDRGSNAETVTDWDSMLIGAERGVVERVPVARP